LGRLDVGGATAGGVGIVILAIVLDRITQGMTERANTPGRVSLRQTLVGFFRPRGASASEPSQAN